MLTASPAPVDDALDRSNQGLSSATVKQALQRFGANEIDRPAAKGPWSTVMRVLTEPMLALLLLAAAIYLVFGDLAEGLLLMVFACASVALTLIQERRSERALDALRSLASPKARVTRDGVLQTINARDLVPADLLVLLEGDRIGADGVVLQTTGLTVDESLLTGESVAVVKQTGDTVFAGTLVVGGEARVDVRQTGAHTQVGAIGASLIRIESAPTPLQLQLRRIVQIFGAAAVLVSGGLTLWYGLVRAQWFDGMLAGVALGMAMLPEELPVALVVFMALGAWRLARVKVLARRPAVIEALGAATVLCVDKTGTLTENRMSLQRLVTSDMICDLVKTPPAASALELLRVACQASRVLSVDPMDRAIQHEGSLWVAKSIERIPLREYPISPALRATANAWPAGNAQIQIALKGAPEDVLALCELDVQSRQRWLVLTQELAQQGLRVLAVAEAMTNCVPASAADITYTLHGLLGFKDPLRSTVPAAMAQAREAGVAVSMITGDHRSTALAIAAQSGIDIHAGALDGSDIDRLDDQALQRTVCQIRVFARVSPAHKLRLVQAFKANGEIVAMTGDGVNDAPALKAAHIGIAMGARGTDVAREAAGLVLLDDDFSHIVAGIRLGRRIHDNLGKVMTYITAIHVPIAGLALIPIMAGYPPLLLPVHVVLTEMVVDPACSLAFEGAPERLGLMQRPPRRASVPLIGVRTVARGLLQGAALLIGTLAVFWAALATGRDIDTARSLTIVSLTLGNLMLVGLNLATGLGWRSMLKRELLPFWGVTGVTLSALGVAMIWAPARDLLHFARFDLAELALAVATVLVMVGIGVLASMTLARDPNSTMPSSIAA